MPRFFTLDQATALLPTVAAIVDDLILARDAIIARRPDVAAALAKTATNGGNRPAALAVADYERFGALLARLKTLGILLKDLDMGLVDFPSMREGREVFLCWHKGEDAIRYWHEVHTGFSGRIPL